MSRARQSPSSDATKSIWREWARSIDVSSSSSLVSQVLDAWPPLHGIMATYLPMPAEVDVESLNASSRRRALVPRIEDGGELSLHHLDSAELARHAFGFLEPSPGSEPVDLEDVDVMLVPGLAFDRSGNRLGKGGGMYDRLLSRLPIGVARVGVAADDVIVERLPTDAHDQPVQWIATESGIRRTGGALPASSEMVVEACIEAGIAPAMIRFPEGTRTSQDAADAVGCELGAIAKSLVFMVDDTPVLVICSGDHRVDEAKLAGHFDAASARPASLSKVREVTGFVAGGTPAVGHFQKLEVVADPTLARYRWLWSAGGTPDTVYPVSLERLMDASGARWADVAERG